MLKSVPAKQFVHNPFESTPLNAAPFPLASPHFKTVQAIRIQGALSRSNISEVIGYSPAKITSVVNDLTARGILMEVSEGKSNGGRRSRDLAFNPDFAYIVAATIGTGKLDIALVDFSAHIRLRRMLPIDVKDGADGIMTLICNFIEERTAQLGIPASKILAFGITVPGAVDVQTGALLDTSLMVGWGGYQPARLIHESFPHAVVIVEKDANAMAFAELRKHELHTSEHFLYLKLGSTLSAGIIINGQIYHGANGAAGEIGQISVTLPDGERVPLDAITSDVDIAAHTPTAEGDPAAVEIIQRSGQALGEALATLINFLDPDLILIGGGSQLAHPLLITIRRSILDRSPTLSTQHLRVELAPLGSEASILGAIALALESVFELEI